MGTCVFIFFLPRFVLCRVQSLAVLLCLIKQHKYTVWSSPSASSANPKAVRSGVNKCVLLWVPIVQYMECSSFINTKVFSAPYCHGVGWLNEDDSGSIKRQLVEAGNGKKKNRWRQSSGCCWQAVWLTSQKGRWSKTCRQKKECRGDKKKSVERIIDNLVGN